MGIVNFYLVIIYILFIYVMLLTTVAVALLVALMVTIRKLDKIKNTSLSGHRDVFLNKKLLYDTPHFCGISSSIFIILEY